MKKILFLVKEYNSNKENLVKQLEGYLGKDKYDLQMGLMRDIDIDIKKGQVSVKLNSTHTDFRDFDFVYFRRVGSEYFWLASAVTACLDYYHLDYIDSVYRLASGNKLANYVKLALADLPVIPSLFFSKNRIIDNFDRISRELGLPFVAKELRSQRGKGVTLIRQKGDLHNLLKDNPGSSYLMQQFIRCRSEYRVLVLEKTIGAFETKTSSNPDEFRNNVSLGAKEEFFDVGSIPKNLKDISIEAARVSMVEIAGVDIMLGEDSAPYLLEVNRGPGFTYDDERSPEVKNIAFYLKRKLYSPDVKKLWPMFFKRA